MDFEQILVFVVILAAAGYVGRGILIKARGMSPGSRCGSSCGCSADSRDSHTAL